MAHFQLRHGKLIAESVVQYHFRTQEGHSVTVAPSKNPEIFEAKNLQISISETQLISDPDKKEDLNQQGHVLLVPLGAQAQHAFDLLSKLDPQLVSASPLLTALFEFKDQRLPELLSEINKPTPVPTSAFAALSELGHNPKLAAKILTSIVQNIESKLPGYFKPERETGVWEWLKSGGTLPTEFTIKDEIPAEKEDDLSGRYLLTELSSKRAVFDVKNQSLHVANIGNPTTLTVLSALCSSGTLGPEIVEFNRAALLNTLTEIHRRSIAIHEGTDPKPFLRTLITKPASNFLRSRIGWGIASAGCSTGIAINTLSHLLQGSVTGGDVAAAALATLLGMHTMRLWGQYKGIKENIEEAASELATYLKTNPVPEGRTSLRLLSTVLVDYFVSMSGGRQNTFLGERTAGNWDTELPQEFIPDIGTLPHERVAIGQNIEVERPRPLEVSCMVDDDFSAHDCGLEQALNLALPKLSRAAHIERGAILWNTLHALSVLQDFAEIRGIPVPKTLGFNTTTTLLKARAIKADERGSYPPVTEAFMRITSHFKINRSTWDTISFALQAASTLERISQTRKAQSITVALLEKNIQVPR